MHFSFVLTAAVLIAGAFGRVEFEDITNLEKKDGSLLPRKGFMGSRFETRGPFEGSIGSDEEGDKDDDNDDISPEEGKAMFRMLVKIVGSKRAVDLVDDIISEVRADREESDMETADRHREPESAEKDNSAESAEKDNSAESAEKDNSAESAEEDRDRDSAEEDDDDISPEEGKALFRMLVKLVGAKRAVDVVDDIISEVKADREESDMKSEGRQRDFAPEDDDHDDESAEEDKTPESAEEDRDPESSEEDQKSESAEEDNSSESAEEDNSSESAEKDNSAESAEEDNEPAPKEEEEEKPSRALFRPRSMEARKEAQALLDKLADQDDSSEEAEH